MARRIAILLGATALAGAVPFHVTPADAQQIINNNGAKGDDGADVIGDADADDGGVPTGDAIFTNNTPQDTVGSAFVGTAKGGDGGDGGTALNFVLGIPPVEIQGGDGGDGRNGGLADITNTSQLSTSGANAAAMVSEASGGKGGDAGFGAALGYSDGGDGGNGGNGGTARATTTATSVISTTGFGSIGILVNASGGLGGNGGTGASFGLGVGGDGGTGGNGGTAYGNNGGRVETQQDFAKGMLVRSAGGSGGNGKDGGGLIAGNGGNGGVPTVGGTAEGINSGTIITHGNFASGMVVQSVGGGGGDGGGAFGIWGGGGAGADGNDGSTATGTNTGAITTDGIGSIGMLVESVGGGGGDGGGAVGIVAVGGSGGGGGKGGTVTANLGGTITTGKDGSGDGAHGVLIQSVGGGGGNGGFAVAAGPIVAVAIGGSGGTGGEGGAVIVNKAADGPTVSTSGSSAIGILAQSVGGGGGNGGGSFAVAGVASVSIGGSGSAAGDGGEVTYDVGAAKVTTNGSDSIGILAQSVGGGGGNGGFAIAGALAVGVSVGGESGVGGGAKKVDLTTSGTVTTQKERSTGIVAQSIGGGGGNGGFAASVSLGVSVGVGGKGGAGGAGGDVTFDTSANQAIKTSGEESTGLIVQSIGGGGGNGGFAAGASLIATVNVGGKAGTASKGGIVDATYNGSIETLGDRSAGAIIQSVGGGGGNGGGTLGLSLGASVGIGGAAAGGGNADTVTFRSTSSITVNTSGVDSAGIIAQSIGGGGGNGGFSLNLAGVASVGIGGKGGAAGDAQKVVVDIKDGSVTTRKDRSTGIIAQSVGGGGGTGGFAINAALGPTVGVGGKGGLAGGAETVSLTNGADVTTGGIQSHGMLAQSIGGGGGSGGFAISVGGPALAIAGVGNAGGTSAKVTVNNSGVVDTTGDMSIGIFAQSVGGSGGDGGLAGAGGLFAGIAIGGKAGGGGNGGEVDVTNTAKITTRGALAHGILAQSIGGGGGNGGAAASGAVGLFGAAAVSVAGDAGDGREGRSVIVRHTGNINVGGAGAKGIMAQSVGGGGGNGGMAFSFAASVGPYVSAAVGVSVGGGGGTGGGGGDVTVIADGNIIADAANVGTGGILAQSIGGSGGNGGRAMTIAGSISNGVSVNLGVAVGGGGGGGGGGKTVKVDTGLVSGGRIETSGYQAAGIMAQSIGGSGGSGGDSWGAAGGYGLNVTVSATVTIGGAAGDGNVAGEVHVRNAMTIMTGGDLSNGIMAQSIGGGGGLGGSTNGATAQVGGGQGVNVSANVTIGATGGTGNDGNVVSVTNSGAITTRGDLSNGIFAMSIGGGGGVGGSSNAKAFKIGGTSETSVTANIGVGGKGGAGGKGEKVTVDNSGVISTQGYGSSGIVALSVGGGGGGAGAASVGEEGIGGGDNGDTSVSIGVAVGLAGGGSGNGGDVEVSNRSLIFTDGEDSYGISASSIGGGGGIGGSASAGADAEYAIGGSIAGNGGGSGDGQSVKVTNYQGAQIWTKQERSIGIFAQSIGGGGGYGGAGKSTGSDGGTVDIKLTLAGSGEVGGSGGQVDVINDGVIRTEKAYSHGIMAQSIGGAGGNGGAAGTAVADASVNIGFSLGGSGGSGGTGGAVHVINGATGVIETRGDSSHGVFAQSIGGGGGSAGGGSTESGEAEEVAVTLSLGGGGGDGSKGGFVWVENKGGILTNGYIAHGIFAQSVGGGGGASGAAANTSEATMTIGGSISLPGGEGAAGGDVRIDHDGLIETMKAGSVGIFAQSVGGGGGYGGVVSADGALGDSVTLAIGGVGGEGANGGNVTVNVRGDIITHGERAHGVIAQSVGGGGGYGGDAKGKTSTGLAIGGFGGGGGNGGDVTVERTGTITTTGKDSIAIFAQSVGGGGGAGGAGFGRFGADPDGGSGLDNNTVGFKSPSGGKGNGGIVKIIQDGEVVTTGDRGHGIVAQAVGGGGGMGGTDVLALGQSGAGSLGGIGDAAAVAATAKSQVWVQGEQAYALFGQSATGQGISGAVDLVADSSLFAQGADSIAAYAESTSNLGFAKGDINLDLKGRYAIGGGATGVAIALVGGDTNTVTNNSLTFAMGAAGWSSASFSTFALAAGPVVPEDAILESLLYEFSPLSVTGTSGDDQIDNKRTATALGRVIGNMDLGGGINGFDNFETASLVTLTSIDLGGGLLRNRGLYTMNGIGVLGTTGVVGDMTQIASGAYVVDIDLNTDLNDLTNLTGAGSFAGEAQLNFLTIDRLFDQNIIATGTTMSTTMQATLARPAVGFNFLTKAEGGNLILYADNRTFRDLLTDPASGVSDSGTVEFAQYLDGLEDQPALYDSPSELARLINLLRFLPNSAELGKTLARLTPSYAAHTFEMINRQTDTVLEASRQCTDTPATYLYEGRCFWFSFTPDAYYERDTGPNTTFRRDEYRTLSMGALGQVSDSLSLGATIARTDLTSNISLNGDPLSETIGESWQAHALARYVNGGFFADVSVGGGTGQFSGNRDTTVAQGAFTPGETLGGMYLPDEMFDGIGNRVTYNQNTAQAGGSARLGYSQELGGGFYVNPQVQFDARWLRVAGREFGSVAAFTFEGSENTFYSATPGLEIGADVALSDKASLRLFAKGGVEFSTRKWEIEGQFAAAGTVGAPPLKLTQEIDTPLYRVTAGAEVNGTNGVGLAVKYSGAFGETVNFQSVNANLKVRF